LGRAAALGILGMLVWVRPGPRVLPASHALQTPDPSVLLTESQQGEHPAMHSMHSPTGAQPLLLDEACPYYPFCRRVRRREVSR